jgi:hypothetical protein
MDSLEKRPEVNHDEAGEERPERLLRNTFATPAQGVHRAFGKVTVGGFFTERLFTFRPNEMRFLREFGPETSIEEAAKKAGVPVDVAQKMLKRRSVREFLQDKFQQVAIQNGWTVERWMAEGDKVWRGQKVISREQLDVWKEFGARILPKTKSGAAANDGERPQITININAVDEAFRRQEAIKAEIINAEGTL